MSPVDILVVILVCILIFAVIFFRYILPNLLNRKVENNKEREDCNSCANCKRH